MAQKLHDTYGYSYDNLQVLLGGWTTWKEKNGTDPTGYPVEITGNGTPAPAGGSSTQASAAPVGKSP